MSLPLTTIERNPDNRTEQRTDEEDEQEGFPAQKGPQHGEKIDIPAPHPLSPRQCLVVNGDKIEGAGPDHDAEKGVDDREPHEQNGQNGKDRNPAQGQDMGDDLMIEIDEGDDDERADEKEHDGIRRRQTVFPEEEARRKPR